MGNRPEQVELGSKMLNAPSDIEVKGLIQISRSPESFSPGLSAMSNSRNLKTRALQLSSETGIPIRKTRWLRQFSTAETQAREITLSVKERQRGEEALPATGCNVDCRIRSANKRIAIRA